MADTIVGKVVGVGDFEKGEPMGDYGGPIVVLLVDPANARKAAQMFGQKVALNLRLAEVPAAAEVSP